MTTQGTTEINFRVLLVANEERNTHGLRYNDYSRYRKHCARKVHRLRQVLKLTHGKGREFKKLPPLSTEQIKDGNLQLLLFECERAWAYAQELLAEHVTSQDSSVRRHALSRFRRAIHFSTQLRDHSSTLFSASPPRITPIAYAEILAYVLMIQGRFSRTKDEFEDGLKQLAIARAILDELGNSATSSKDQALAAVFSDEIGPEIRYCAHELRREKAYDIDGIVAELTPKHAKQTVPGYDDLIATIKRTSRTGDPSSSSNQLEPLIFEGQPVPIRNPELVDVFLRVQAASRLLEGAPPGVGLSTGKDTKKTRNKARGNFAAFDAVLLALSEAEELARKLLEAQQLSHSSSQSAGPQTRDGTFIHSYISYLLISRRIQRDLSLVEALVHSASASPSSVTKAAKAPESTAPLDARVYPAVVKLLDTALQSLEQMRSLSVTDESPEISTGIDARQSFTKAKRCYYLTLAHALAKNYAQSLALNSRAVLHLRESRSLLVSASPDSKELSFFPLTADKDIEPLAEALELDGLRLKKEWFAYNGGHATTSVNTGEDGKKHKKSLFFDVAFNYLQSPMSRLEGRAGKVSEEDAPPAGVVPAVTAGTKKGKVDKEEELIEEKPAPSSATTEQPVQQARGGLGGLLGGWWGRR